MIAVTKMLESLGVKPLKVVSVLILASANYLAKYAN